MCSPTWETHIPSEVCFPYPGTISLVICVSPTRKLISLVICVSPTREHISLVVCVFPTRENISLAMYMCFPYLGTHIPSAMCIPSDMCFPYAGTHIPTNMCFPYPGTHIPSDICFPSPEHIFLVICATCRVKQTGDYNVTLNIN